MKRATTGTQRKGTVDKVTSSSAAANGAKPLSKSLSKSHDNLASTLRKKAAAASLLAGNKENVRERFGSPARGLKTPKTPSTPIRKAQSAHNIGDADAPGGGSESVQNVARAAGNGKGTDSAAAGSKSNLVKRAVSTQNVSNKNSNRQVRTSAPAQAMAYNAELLASFEKEKKALERKISEQIQVAEGRKTEIEKFKYEVKNLKEERDSFRVENKQLREKLKEVGLTVPPLNLCDNVTDSEKLQSLSQRGSFKEDVKWTDGGGGSTGAADSLYARCSLSPRKDLTDNASDLPQSEPALSIGNFSCMTPDHPSSFSLDNNWDKHSTKSSDGMSEVSVACLQDRISQMEETHYSTNEELEATRLELADLQDAVNELTDENERLADEKQVLLESLCAQTEKLETCRFQIEYLKTLLVSDADSGGRMDKEKHALMALLRNAQVEKEEMWLRQKELSNAFHIIENENRELQDVVTAVRDKTHILEMKKDSSLADNRSLETQLAALKEKVASELIELQRYKTLLENERQKVLQLEQQRNATDKSDLEELLDSARQEKEALKQKLANVHEELAVSQNRVGQLEESLSALEQELKVCKNNGKSQVSDLQYELQQRECRGAELQRQVEELRSHLDQVQLEFDACVEEKKCQSSSLAALEAELHNVTLRNKELEVEVKEIRARYDVDKEEWQQFQMDMAMAVKIANNFKTEAQEGMEKTYADYHFYKAQCESLEEKVSSLQEELTKIKQEQEEGDAALLARHDLRGKVISTVDRELAVFRHGRKLSDPRGGNPSLSVKHLIQTIEEHVKPLSPGLSPGLPLSPTIQTTDSSASSRRNSYDSIKSETAASPALATPAERRVVTGTAAGDPPLKGVLRRSSEGMEGRSPLGHRHTISNIIMESTSSSDMAKKSPNGGKGTSEVDGSGGKKPRAGILANKSGLRKSSLSDAEGKTDKSPYVNTSAQGLKSDPLANLAKQIGGSKRNALLRWCQNRTASYTGIDITNFSSSWNDGLAFCAVLHSYLPLTIPYKELSSQTKMRNFTLAFKAGESVGIPSILNANDMVCMERPDWQAVMTYITSIYKHFEVDTKA